MRPSTVSVLLLPNLFFSEFAWTAGVLLGVLVPSSPAVVHICKDLIQGLRCRRLVPTLPACPVLADSSAAGAKAHADVRLEALQPNMGRAAHVQQGAWGFSHVYSALVSNAA